MTESKAQRAYRLRQKRIQLRAEMLLINHELWDLMDTFNDNDQTEYHKLIVERGVIK